MSQAQIADYVIDPFSTNGQQLAEILNRIHEAYLTRHSGVARPAYAKPGTLWLDDSSSPHKLYYFDGTNDHEILHAGFASGLPAGGTVGQMLIKQSATDGDADWVDYTSRSDSFQAVDMLGQATADLDWAVYDTFELENIDTAAVVSFSNVSPGMTTIIVLDNAVGNITFSDTILWRGGADPIFTNEKDMVILTAVKSGIIGSFSPGHV